jgi:hypothetical protein
VAAGKFTNRAAPPLCLLVMMRDTIVALVQRRLPDRRAYSCEMPGVGEGFNRRNAGVRH